MSDSPDTLAPEERVLPTLNQDGSRRWLTPQLSRGRFLKWRRVVGWTLIGLFVALPWIQISGLPAIWLNVAARKFVFFGAVFQATDTAVLMLTLLVLFVGIFFATSLLGRIWCGWGCPQTVYMEFVFRPLDRLVARLTRGGNAMARVFGTVAKYAVFLVLAVVLAHTFLAYFVSVEVLGEWIQGSPVQHPGAFALMISTTALIFFDFAYFREQMCTVICPYARLQAALFDRDTLVISYDRKRGEPRGKGAAKEIRAQSDDRQFGDCIDCGACVRTCPTGIDIRDGVQLECIACAQCVDACDHIMTSIGAPIGLVRYGSERSIEERRPSRLVRPRTAVYLTLLLGFIAALIALLSGSNSFEAQIFRGPGAPFTQLPSGEIRNSVRLRLTNNTGEKVAYEVRPGEATVDLLAPQNPFPVAAHSTASTPIYLTVAGDSIVDGSRRVEVLVEGREGKIQTVPFTLLGPTTRSTP